MMILILLILIGLHYLDLSWEYLAVSVAAEAIVLIFLYPIIKEIAYKIQYKMEDSQYFPAYPTEGQFYMYKNRLYTWHNSCWIMMS
jgi:hypothetical protein